MKDIRVSDSIMPLSEFKAKAATVLKGLAEQDTPLVITQNGRPAAVLLSPVAFDELREKQRFLEAVIAGVADIEQGHVVEHERVVEWLSSWGTEHEKDVPL